MYRVLQQQRRLTAPFRLHCTHPQAQATHTHDAHVRKLLCASHAVVVTYMQTATHRWVYTSAAVAWRLVSVQVRQSDAQNGVSCEGGALASPVSGGNQV